MPTAHTTRQIVLAVLDKMAAGHGFTRTGPTAHFDSTVLVDQTHYHVVMDPPEQAPSLGTSPRWSRPRPTPS